MTETIETPGRTSQLQLLIKDIESRRELYASKGIPSDRIDAAMAGAELADILVGLARGRDTDIFPAVMEMALALPGLTRAVLMSLVTAMVRVEERLDTAERTIDEHLGPDGQQAVRDAIRARAEADIAACPIHGTSEQ